MAKKKELFSFVKGSDMIGIEGKTICIELPVSDDDDAIVIEISCEQNSILNIKNTCKDETILLETNIKSLLIK